MPVKRIGQLLIRRRRRRVALAAAAMSSALVACTPVVDTRTESAESTIGAIEAIQTLGEIGLPAWPQIMDFETDTGADTRYRMVLRLDEGQLSEFLSQFPLPPQPSEIPRSMSVIAGPSLNSAPDPLYLQDTVSSPDGGWIREIIIDQRGPDEAYVHVALFTV